MRGRQRSGDTALWLEHLAAAARAGVSFEEMLERLVPTAADACAAQHLHSALRALREGASLGAALQGWPGLESRFVSDWLDAASAAQQADETVAKVLAYLAADVRWLRQRRMQWRMGLMWPLWLLITATSVSLCLSIFVLPGLNAAMADMSGVSTASFQPSSLQLWGTSGLLAAVTVVAALMTLAVLWLVLSRSRWPDRALHGLRLDGGRWTYETQLRLWPLLAQSEPHWPVGPGLAYLADTTPLKGVAAGLQGACALVAQDVPVHEAVAQQALVPAHVQVHLELARRTHNVPAMAQQLTERALQDWVESTARMERRVTWLVYGLAAAMAWQLLEAVYLPIFRLGQFI